jgi:hypothetical protein
MKNSIKAFIAGSAFPVVIWPFLYLGISFHLYPQSEFNIGLMPATLPFIYGIANMVSYKINKTYPTKNINKRMLVTGGVIGLLLTSYGNFVAHLPTKLFHLSGAMQYLTMPFAIILYALVWRYIVLNLNRLIGLK